MLAADQRPCHKQWPDLDPDQKRDRAYGLLVQSATRARVEACRAWEKYPSNTGLFVSLLQEAGELATQLRVGDAAKVATEAEQVAALALRIAVEGDAEGAHAFDPLQEIYERDQEVAQLKLLLDEARTHLRAPEAYTDGRNVWRKEAVPLDENDCPLPTCTECGAYHEVVRPGKTQPTCLCEAFRHEVDRHREMKELAESLRAEVKRLRNHLYTNYLDTVDGEKP